MVIQVVMVSQCNCSSPVIAYLLFTGKCSDKINDYIMISSIDSKLAEELITGLEGNQIDIFNTLNCIMGLKDCIRMLRCEDIDINSITAYIVAKLSE